MADGKITFEASVETKEARKELASLEKNFVKLSGAIAQASGKLKSMQSSRMSPLAKNIETTTNALEEQRKQLKLMQAESDTWANSARGIAVPEFAKYDALKRNPNANPGLLAANAKKWGIDFEQYKKYQEYIEYAVQAERNLIDIKQKTAELESKLSDLRERQKTESTEGKTKQEVALEEKLKNLLEQRLQLVQQLEATKQRVIESEQADAENAENEARLQRQIEQREKIRRVITSCGNALKWSAQMGYRFVKSLTIDKVTRGFSKLTASVRNFGRRLKFVVLQGLLFRNLRKYLSEFAQSIGSAFSQNEQLNASLANLKGTFWASIAPVVDALAPIIARFIDMIAKLITYLSGLIGILFNIGKASKAAGAGLAKAGKSGKDASNNLASWDTIQNLDKGSSGGDDSGISPTFGQDFEEAYSGLEKFRELFEKGDWFEIGKYVGEKLNEVIDVVDEWVTSKLNPALKKIGEDIAKFINGFVVGFDFNKFGKLIADVLNGIIENIATFFETLDTDSLGKAFSDIINGIFENFDVTRLGQAISEIFKKVLGLLVSFIENTNWQLIGNKVAEFIGSIDFGGIAKVFFEGIGAALGGLALFLFGIVEKAIKDVKEWWASIMKEAGGDVALGILLGIIDVFKSIYEWIKEHIFQPLIDGIKKVFGIHSPAEEMKPLGDNIAQGLLLGISNVFKSINEWVDRNIMTPIVNAISTQMVKIKAVWDSLEQKITSVWSKVKLGAVDAWNGIKNVFSTVTTWFRDKFSAAWEAVKNVFSTGGRIFTGIKEGIETTFKNIVNRIIDGVNTVVSIPFNAINRFLNTLRNASILGVRPFGWIGNISIPRIPRLAQGGVINPGHEFAAILGDNRKEQEVVSPLSTMKQALLDALSEYSGNTEVVLEVDGRKFATAMIPHINNRTRAYGTSVVL